MKQFQALLYKEWRDQRALLAGMYVLCVLLVVVARLVAGRQFTPQFREATMLQACLAVIVVVLAVESVVRDHQGRVDETLARLPIRTAPGWAAKIVFVALAACAVLAGLVLLEAVMLLVEGHPLLGGLLSMIQPAWWCAIAALGASCHACAYALRRSLPAALLGIALIVGVPLAAGMLPVGRATEIVDLFLASWTPVGIGALLCTAFLLGSLLARGVRRPDVLGWRRPAGAMLGVGLVLGPAFANSMRLGQWAFDIVPFSRSAEVKSVWPSPDGRYIAMQMTQNWAPRRDWLPLTGSRTGTNGRTRFEVWILDSQTGEVQEVDERFRAFPMDDPWDAQGRLATVSTTGAFGDGECTAERIDPATATVVASHPESESDSQDYRYGFDRWLERTSDGDQRVYSLRGTRLELRLPPDVVPKPSPEPGVLFYSRDRALVRYEFEGRSSRTLAESLSSNDSSFEVSPDGRYLQLRNHGRTTVLDSKLGLLVAELPRESGFQWSRIPGRIGYVCSSRSGAWFREMLLEDGAWKELPGLGDRRAREFGDDHMLAVHNSNVECVKLDGTERHVLYGAKR